MVQMIRKGFRNKRGRPKTMLPQKDVGTPELVEKRAAGITMEAIDLYLAKNWLSAKQHRAALHLRWLYTLRFGCPTLQACRLVEDYTSANSSRNEDGWDDDRANDYRQAISHLEELGCLDSVIRVAIFNDIPPIQPSSQGKASLATPCPRLLKGLDALCCFWSKPTLH